jgi:VanZ family protein
MTAPVSEQTVSSWRTESPIDRLLFRFRRWIVAVLIPLWIAAVIASHIPQENLPELPTNGKILHFLGFFGLSTLMVLALAAYGKGALKRNLWTLLIFAAYAAFDEGTQPYFHRHGCVSDWVLDTSSAALALIVWQAMLLAVKLLVDRTHRAREMQRKIHSYLDAHCQNL